MDGAARHRRHRKHCGARARAAERGACGERRQQRPQFARLLSRGADAHDGMVLALGSDHQLVVRRGISVAEGCARETASAIVELHRQRNLERCADEPPLRKRFSPQHQQAGPSIGDELGGHPELRAREEVGFDVGDDQCIVGV